MSKNNGYQEIHIPNAENVRADTNKKLVINWIDKIEKAKREGNTCCYVTTLNSCGVTRYVVQKFIDADYDIYFNHFTNGEWYVKVRWEDGCHGRIYSEKDRRYVSIDEMFI